MGTGVRVLACRATLAGLWLVVEYPFCRAIFPNKSIPAPEKSPVLLTLRVASTIAFTNSGFALERSQETEG